MKILSTREKAILERESKAGFWHQPKDLKVTIATLCVAAIVQGWNQTGSNGANLNWPRQFGLNIEGCTPTGHDAWIFAIVNAATYLAAGLVGCWFSDPLNELFFGRRAAVCISAILIFASIVGCACTQSWQALLACRILLGLGMGCKASVVPVFAAEVAPAHIRGSLVMNWQLFDALGIFFGFTANLAVSGVGQSAWRWQTASSVLPAIVLLALIYVTPESPRFLIKKGYYESAYKALLGLRGEPVLAAKELFYVHCQRNVEMRFLSGTQRDPEAHQDLGSNCVDYPRPNARRFSAGRFWPTKSSSGTAYFRKLVQLFTDKRNSRALIAACVCMASQQLCGINVLAFYSTTFFCSAGTNEDGTGNTTDETDLAPLFLSWGLGLANVVFAIPAYYLIDPKGRRWLLLVTLPFCALTMLAASLSYLFLEDTTARAGVVGLFIYFFWAFYSWGLGPVPFTLSAEVFPLENRVVGMSFAVFVNLFGAGLLTLFVPWLTHAVGHPGMLGIFAGLNVVAFVLVFFFVRETAGASFGGTPGSMTFMSLEELNYLFGVTTSAHAAYQYHKVIPWAWRYYILRDPECPASPEKAYIWAATRERERVEREEIEVREQDGDSPAGIRDT